ncbi:MAG: terminase large subunit [Actinomycetota bacterium]|nr:terminase large subunit [Actinomycetota bacterium]
MSALDSALDLLSGLVLEDGRRWGEVAESFQWADARAVLDPTSETPYHFLTRARGGSKTADLAGMGIVAMLAQLPPGSRLYGLAADRDQGRLLVDSIQGYANRTPELRGALDVQAYRVVATRSASVIEVLAADAPGAWGLRPALTIADELAQWAATGSARRLWEAASSAAAKLSDSRLVVLTTAGDPAHWSRKVLDHALADPLWRVHEVAGPPPWMDEERLGEQRRRLLESSYRRLFENEWVTSEDRLASEDDLRACVTLEGPLAPEPGMRYVIGLDLGLKSDRTVAAVCHAVRTTNIDGQTTATKVVLDRMQVWAGTRDNPVQLAAVEEWLVEAATSYRAIVRCDPWQAVGSMQRLRSRGVRCEEFTFSSASVGRLASTLHLLLRNGQLALPDDADLLDELRHVRLRETSPGVVRMDHDADQHDDRAIALALAASRLLDRPQSDGSASVEGEPILGRWESPLGDPSLGAVKMF